MFKIKYDARVKKDIANLSSSTKNRLKKAIEAKLTEHPERYSKHLRGSLDNFRSLRVGEYRIIFLLEREPDEIFILLIAHKKDVYKKAEQL